MQSTAPREGDRWPHAMTIRVQHAPLAVIELLWIREAYALHPPGDAPPPLVDTPPRAGEADDVRAWEESWRDMWEACVRHAAGSVGPGALGELARTADGFPERAAVLRGLRGPSWRDRLGDAAFTDDYRRWDGQRADARPRVRSLADSPERRALDALVPAWEAGLSTIITIPCRGEHTRVVGDSGLLMTAATRADPERYAAALAVFR